ncbi:MAG: hypothetical protein RIN56_15360 [Sporomusaceae bacterium]|nr:hypothetical protein [Sporomusaceae bacterium]
MKKRLLSAAIMAALTISTATAFAAPVITGDAQTMIQTTKGSGDYSDARIRLNFDFDMGEGMYAHARLMGIDQQMQGTGLNYAEAGTGSKGSEVNMEQMYIGSKFGQVDAKFGRQPVSVGQNMLADVNGIQGISLAGKAGDFNLYGFGGRSVKDDVLAASIDTKVQAIDMGAGYLKREDNKYWSVNAGGKVAENVGLTGIYMKNNTAKADGYMIKATVGQAANKGDFSYAVSFRDIENNAVDGDWVTNGALADSKGVRLEAKYKPTNNATLWVYQDITKKSSDASIKPNQFRAELDFNF